MKVESQRSFQPLDIPQYCHRNHFTVFIPLIAAFLTASVMADDQTHYNF